jgi:hypothetical protein
MPGTYFEMPNFFSPNPPTWEVFGNRMRVLTDFMEANGLVRTNDTGQLDWEVDPGNMTTAYTTYYVMYRFSDSLQSEYPYFIKLVLSHIQSTSVTSSRIGIQLQLGTQTDGAGNFASVFSTIQFPVSTYSSSTGTSSSASGIWLHVRPNSLFILSWPVITTSNHSGDAVQIERSLNAQGQETGDYIAILRYGASHSYRLDKSGNVVTFTDRLAMAPQGVFSSGAGNQVVLYPVLFNKSGRFLNPLRNTLIGLRDDWTEHGEYTIPDAYGNPHLFKAFRGRGGSNMVKTDSTNAMTLVRWD